MSDVAKIANGLTPNAKRACMRWKHSVELASAGITNWRKYTPLGLAVRQYLQEQGHAG